MPVAFERTVDREENPSTSTPALRRRVELQQATGVTGIVGLVDQCQARQLDVGIPPDPLDCTSTDLDVALVRDAFGGGVEHYPLWNDRSV